MTITNEAIVVYTVIGIIALIDSYVYGYTRAQRKGKQSLQIHLDEIDRLAEIEVKLDRDIRMVTKACQEWQRKHTDLQKEIETYVHEGSHADIQDEKPHVYEYNQNKQSIGTSSYMNKGHQEWLDESDNQTTVNGQTPDDMFWGSLSRARDNDQ